MPGRRLLPGVALAPALLGLGLVLLAEAVAEELLELLGRGGSLLHLSLQCSVDGRDELLELAQPGHDRVALPAQVLLRRPLAVEQGPHLGEGQAEPAVGDDGREPGQVGIRVEAVPGVGARARHDEALGVVVVQRAHRDAEGLGHLADGELHPCSVLARRGHVTTVTPDVA